MPELKNEFTWSKSRDSLFKECLRAYYYNHYGSWGGWSYDAPRETRELYIMKKLNNKATWMGIVVHDVAERALRQRIQGRDWPLESALTEAETRMREELDLSRRGAYRHATRIRWGSERIKADGLQEHYYESTLPEEEWAEIIQQSLDCIRTFYSSATYGRLRRIDSSSILTVEELESFLVEDVKVWVKLDVAVEGKNDDVIIVDWKTGSAHKESDIALQLGIYGLYGTEKWDIDASRLGGFDVNLRDGSTRRHNLTAETLGEVREYIIGSAQQMRERLDDVKNNAASIGNFPQTDNESTCRRCRFRRACQRE